MHLVGEDFFEPWLLQIKIIITQVRYGLDISDTKDLKI